MDDRRRCMRFGRLIVVGSRFIRREPIKKWSSEDVRYSMRPGFVQAIVDMADDML